MDENLRHHNFDGIQEYDNQLPRWWVYKFILTVLFSGAYLYWFVFTDIGTTLYNEFRADARRQEQEAARLTPKKEITEDELKALAKDPVHLQKGAAIFSTRCSPCHGAEGQGLVGPNLTDPYWIHGSSFSSVRATISNGVPEKGMVPWKTLLSDDEVTSAAIFVKSLKGKKVNNPKKAEGNFSDD